MIAETDAEKPRFTYKYFLIALAFIIQAVFGGTLYTFSIFFKPLASEFDWTRAATSGAFSLYMLLHGFLYIFTGRLNDRFGTRVVMSGCGILMGIGYLLMSQINTLWHLYFFYGIVIAIGMSGGFVPLMSTVTRWFVNDKRRGLMLGISLAGGGVGTMIMPPIANWLISTYGWRTSYIIIGVMVLAIITLAAQFIKRAPENLPHLGDPEKKEPVGNNTGLSLSEAARTKQFWQICGVYFSFGLILQAIMVHMVLHAIGLGISASAAANIFIAIGALSVTGRIVLGSIYDKIGNKNLLILCFSMLTLALLWLLWADEAWMLFVFAVIFGFAYGGLVSAQSPLVADLFGMKSHGVILGVIVSVITAGAAVGPVMAGGIFDATGGYFPAFAITVGFGLTGLVIALFLKPVKLTGEGGAG